ncbi:MAG: hypothetical protein HYT80_09750 [Euryarchaeota archaeon]|nr:hypothetical protein [Euryarchaeota archaeon]
MDKKTVGRILGLLVVSGGLAASIITMYVGLARFEPVWFWSSVGGYIVLLFLVLFIFRIRPEEEDAAKAVAGRAPLAGKAGALAAASLEEAPIEVQKATGMLPVEAATREEAPPGFAYRGFTLYATTVAGKTTHVFAKKPPANAEPVLLPTGHEAVWDAKKKAPKLVRLVDETPEVVIERGAGRPCSAWTTPGEICENVALAGSPYCKAHAKYRSGDEWGTVDAQIARRDQKGGMFRSAAPKMEVITARPKAKPFTVRIPTVDVRTSRPTAKPLKGWKPTTPEVRTARGQPVKPLRLGEPQFSVRLGKDKAPKPLRLGQPRVELRPTKGTPPKPLRLREPDVRFRDTRPKAEKPLRWGRPDIDVRDARPKAAKPLRLREPEVNVRDAHPKAAKPLRFGQANVEVRETRPPARKPLRLAEPKIEIKGASPRAAKPLKIAEPKIEVRVAKPKAAKPLDLVDMSNVEVVSGASKKAAALKGLKPAGEVLVVKDTRGRSDVGVPDDARRKSR